MLWARQTTIFNKIICKKQCFISINLRTPDSNNINKDIDVFERKKKRNVKVVERTERIDIH